jgi:hypothetical protein
MRISTRHQKFLVAFSNENLFVNGAAKGHFSRYVRLPENFSTTPAAIFATPIGIEKLIKAEGLFLVKLREGIDSDSKVLLCLSAVSRLQPRLLRIRLMWLRTF